MRPAIRPWQAAGVASIMVLTMTTSAAAQKPLDLETATPEAGFDLAVSLARKGVATTQPDTDVLVVLREAYARDPQLLIAASQVVATHFATIAAANDYWRDE